MFEFHSTSTDNTTRYKVTENGLPLPYSKVFEHINSSVKFREKLINTLQNCEFDSFFWEVKPFNKKSLSDKFEFVLVEGGNLKNIESDNTPFIKYFNTEEQVVSFDNLGKDAYLIVPTPQSTTCNYAHFASFLRTANRQQIHRFFIKISEAYQARISDAPMWLSTAGLGVHWLHVRFDSRPKYYRFKPYKVFD